MENFVKYDLADHKGTSYRDKYGDRTPRVELTAYESFIVEAYWAFSRFRQGDLEPIRPADVDERVTGFSLSRDECNIIYDIDLIYRQGVIDQRQRNAKSGN